MIFFFLMWLEIVNSRNFDTKYAGQQVINQNAIDCPLDSELNNEIALISGSKFYNVILNERIFVPEVSCLDTDERMNFCSKIA